MMVSEQINFRYRAFSAGDCRLRVSGNVLPVSSPGSIRYIRERRNINLTATRCNQTLNSADPLLESTEFEIEDFQKMSKKVDFEDEEEKGEKKEVKHSGFSIGPLEPGVEVECKGDCTEENISVNTSTVNDCSHLKKIPLGSGEMRPRTMSMPCRNNFQKPRQQGRKPLCRMRSFTTSPRGIINRGDQLMPISITGEGPPKGFGRPRSNSHIGTMSTGLPGLGIFRRRTSSVTSQDSVCSFSSSAEPTEYTALMLGSDGVGKTALMRQFTTSEFTGAEGKDEDYEKTVSILLDGKEYTINFIDVPAEDDHFSYKDVDAYTIVYSITDIDSVQYAEDLLQEITLKKSDDAALILVANKTDLVRSRLISMEEGKSMASDYSCKFIEVSAAVNHRVDELLVGIVSQIKLKPKRSAIKRRKSLQKGTGEDVGPGCMQKAARGLLNKLFKNSKSCDNLLVL